MGTEPVPQMTPLLLADDGATGAEPVLQMTARGRGGLGSTNDSV